MSFFLKIPKEIMFHIMSYTYSPQLKELQNDIIDYTRSVSFIKELYIACWGGVWHLSPAESMDWLENDLIYYINNYEATNEGYTDHFYDVFMRSVQLNTREKVIRMFKHRFGIRPIESDTLQNIHFIFGLLTIQERNDFISGFMNFNEDQDRIVTQQQDAAAEQIEI